MARSNFSSLDRSTQETAIATARLALEALPSKHSEPITYVAASNSTPSLTVEIESIESQPVTCKLEIEPATPAPTVELTVEPTPTTWESLTTDTRELWTMITELFYLLVKRNDAVYWMVTTLVWFVRAQMGDEYADTVCTKRVRLVYRRHVVHFIGSIITDINTEYKYLSLLVTNKDAQVRSYLARKGL